MRKKIAQILKKIAAGCAGLLILTGLLFLPGCEDFFESPDSPKFQVNGEGSFSLEIGGVQTGRTILPTMAQNNFAAYTLVFSAIGRDDITVGRTNTTLSNAIRLNSGTWNLEVTAYMDSEKTKAAATGNLTGITISAGVNVSRSLNLTAVVEAGATGTFRWNIGYPAEIINAGISITPLDATTGTPAQTLYFVGGTPLTNKNNAASPLTLNTGYYQVVFSLSNGKHDTGRREYLHIYKNMESRFEYSFTQDHFTVYSVTSGEDSGPGTLRHAITNAAANSTILIEDGVGTISLAGRLNISKNLTIQGNGAVLARSASWTTVDGSSQLLYISGSSTTVTICRLHFKCGKAADYGSAIRKSGGTLNLESCIFNGNETSAGDAQGGAIDNSGTMNIKGCTFYNNRTGGSYGGGAIYNSSGTLTLTGNLFYGNTASYYSVLYGGGTVISGGYNVVDAVLGTSNTQSGWTAGTGDATFTSLGISGDPVNTATFEPSADAGSVMPPSALADFPALDFYGNARTWPGAPGAVLAAPWISVTDISGVPSTATAGTPLTLAGVISPSNATIKTIVWSVKSMGTTGASISGNTLNTTMVGTIVVTAAITNGAAPGTNYTKEFTIAVLSNIDTITVTPNSADLIKGSSKQFTAAVNGTNNPAQTVSWEVTGGAPGTTISNNGLLTVAMNESAAALTVTASSTVDPSKSGIAGVRVLDGLAIEFTGFGDETINLTLSGMNDISQRNNDFLSVSVSSGYDSYQWYKDGQKVSGSGTSWSAYANRETLGVHTVTLIVKKGTAFYSKEITFKVVR